MVFGTSDEGLKELSKYYLEELKTYKNEYVTTDSNLAYLFDDKYNF